MTYSDLASLFGLCPVLFSPSSRVDFSSQAHRVPGSIQLSSSTAGWIWGLSSCRDSHESRHNRNELPACLLPCCPSPGEGGKRTCQVSLPCARGSPWNSAYQKRPPEAWWLTLQLKVREGSQGFSTSRISSSIRKGVRGDAGNWAGAAGSPLMSPLPEIASLSPHCCNACILSRSVVSASVRPYGL